jgi:ABC-type uncharacterized transport system substrate-binding protein
MTPRARLPLRSRCAFSALVLIGVVLGSSGANARPQGRPYRIGVLNNSFTPGTPTVKGLRAGIKAEGLEEGRDVRFDVRATGAEDRTVAPLAAELARENPDVIVAIGEKETRAAKAAAPETPVVFIQIPDPVYRSRHFYRPARRVPHRHRRPAHRPRSQAARAGQGAHAEPSSRARGV